MGAGETFPATVPSDSMVSDKDNKSAKSLNRAVSNQAYYGPGPIPPPYFAPNAAPPATAYSIVFEKQWPVSQRNVAPMQALILYPQNGLFPHPHVVAEVSAIEKRSNQILAEGTDARNHNVSQFGGANNQMSDVGNHLVSMPQPHLNTMSSNVPSGKSKTKSKVVRITEPDVSAVSTKMGGCKEVKTDQPIQDEHELEKERKRLTHNEAAKRSRIRRQQTCEALQTKVEELSTETSMLKQYLNSYSKDCMKLRRKNKALLDELSQICSPEEISALQSENPDPNQSESSSDSSSDESVDTSNSGLKVEADSK